MKISSFAFLSTVVKVSLVNFFFRPVTVIVASFLLTLLISCSVAKGLGIFWRRVMANIRWKIWFWKGKWSASASRRGVFG